MVNMLIFLCAVFRDRLNYEKLKSASRFSNIFQKKEKTDEQNKWKFDTRQKCATVALQLKKAC